MLSVFSAIFTHAFASPHTPLFRNHILSSLSIYYIFAGKMTGAEPSRAGGNAKSTAGSIKENVGGLVSDQWAAEGKQQRTEGDAEVEAAKTKGYAEGAGDSLAGGAKKNLAKVTGNDAKQAQGEARQTKGDAKKEANK